MSAVETIGRTMPGDFPHETFKLAEVRFGQGSQIRLAFETRPGDSEFRLPAGAQASKFQAFDLETFAATPRVSPRFNQIGQIGGQIDYSFTPTLIRRFSAGPDHFSRMGVKQFVLCDACEAGHLLAALIDLEAFYSSAQMRNVEKRHSLHHRLRAAFRQAE